MNAYLIWFVVAIVLLIIEIFTAGFAVICFSFGCIGAAIVDLCGGSLNWQIGAMLIVTAIAFFTVRPFAIRFLSNKKHDAITNIDAIIGRIGIVSERIDLTTNSGRVALDGDDWKAVSADKSIIEKGEQVRIISHESLIVTVEKA